MVPFLPHVLSGEIARAEMSWAEPADTIAALDTSKAKDDRKRILVICGFLRVDASEVAEVCCARHRTWRGSSTYEQRWDQSGRGIKQK
jgi:hypothetical protein